MPGMDHILSKGLVLSDVVATAITLGTPMVMAANTATNSPGQAVQVAPAGSKGAYCIGLAGENIDLVKVQTGKAFVNVVFLGITKAVADGAISIGSPVVASATLGQINGSPATGNFILGIALEAAVAAGDIIDVLLTPSGLAHA